MRRAFLDEIPRHAQVELGGVVETSGHSFVFPPGIFVGKIDKIDDSADGQSYKLDINLGTDFSNLHEVGVIATPYREAIDSLFSKINDN
jgi:rod shape-determining protein MreC